MSNNTYWGSVPHTLTVYAPGEFEDNCGNVNDSHAIEMGDALVEGTRAQWLALASQIIKAFTDDNATQLEAVLTEVWDAARNAGLIGGSYFDREDVRRTAEEYELGELTNKQARAALKRFHLFEVQDQDTLVDAIRWEIEK